MKSFAVKKERIEETLKSVPSQGKRLLEPLKSLAAQHSLPFNILEDMEVSNDAEVHTHEGDLWYCMQGEVTFVCGGELVDPKIKIKKDGTEDPREINAKRMKNGETMEIGAGDWLWIPAGEPHQHMCKGTARLAIIKIPKT